MLSPYIWANFPIQICIFKQLSEDETGIYTEDLEGFLSDIFEDMTPFLI